MRDLISSLDATTADNPTENTVLRHDAATGLPSNRAISAVAGLADLGNFQFHIIDDKPVKEADCVQVDALRSDVFRECPRLEAGLVFAVEPLYRFYVE